MNQIRLLVMSLLLGAVAGSAYGQAQPYGQSPTPGQPSAYGPPGSYQPGYDDGRGYGYGYSSARAEVGFFYDELSPFGDWILTSDLGWAWFPRVVPPYWRPYTNGRWVTTEYGWTWVSFEPFGWATYHYGRWGWDPRFGWLWYPDTVWGPAWVSWQSGNGYIGWAPLPPSVAFEIGIGLRLGGFDLRFGIRPDAYSFVSERSFLDARVSSHFVPTARNVTIIQNTTNITHYTYIDNRVVNRGLDVRHLEQVTGRRVEKLRVGQGRAQTRGEVTANEVLIYRPNREKLESVRVGPRARAAQHPDARPTARDSAKGQPAANSRVPGGVIVAPRAERVPRVDPRDLDRQEQRQKQDLEQYMAQERKKMDKVHQQQIARAHSQEERSQLERRQNTEVDALRQQQRNATQQLAARLEAQREAALASQPPNAQGHQVREGDGDKSKDREEKNDGGGRSEG